MNTVLSATSRDPPLHLDRDLSCSVDGGCVVLPRWRRWRPGGVAVVHVQGRGGEGGGGQGEVGKMEVVVNSYCGIEKSKKLVREDGTEWKWSCFRPWETYTADTSIDLTKHHAPKTLLDKIAYWTVKSLRFPSPHRCLLLEEVWLPRNDAGDGGGGAGDGGRHVPPPALPPTLRVERRVDPRAVGRG